ncbi:MAG: hypothetical protein CMI60_02620 [Parvibaculum sp.]|jgi:hypothetical protein|nr:hypothetical protein [Parvibaculum sp.]
MAEVTFERILKWRLLPRGMMLVMTYAYLQTLFWFQSLPPDAMTTQAAGLTATVTGAMTGAFGLWLGSEKS